MALAHRRRRCGSRRQGPDRRAGGRRPRLGVVDRGHARRAVHRDQHPVFDVHPVPRRARCRIRRLADAGGAADGVGGDGRAADPAHGGRHRPRNHALRLLRDVRAVARRVAHHHHHGVEPPRALRHLGHRPRADAVDRAGPARPIHHGRRTSRDERRTGRRTAPGGRDGRLRDPLRRSGLGIRGAVDRIGHSADNPHRAPRHAVRADVVEPDVSGRARLSPAPRSWPSTRVCRRSVLPPPSPTSAY